MAEIGLTEWNGSKATLMRIDESLRLCKEARIQEDYFLLYKALLTLSLEPRSKMKKQEFRDKYNIFLKELKGLFTLYKRNPNDFNLKLKFESKLLDFEIFLRDFMDQKGMMMSENMGGGL